MSGQAAEAAVQAQHPSMSYDRSTETGVPSALGFARGKHSLAYQLAAMLMKQLLMDGDEKAAAFTRGREDLIGFLHKEENVD